MRFIAKLLLIVVMTLLAQIAIEVVWAVGTYPTFPAQEWYGEEQADVVAVARDNLDHCSGMTRWLVCRVMGFPVLAPDLGNG